jgi:serine/threonine protein kinase
VERDILCDVDHPFIVKLHFAFHTPAKLYLIVDFVRGGELYFHLRKKGTFSLEEARFFLAELALALGHLHGLGIVYRDLKPENVLVGADGHIKLTDFGLAKKGVSGENKPMTFCGTPLYLAPEAIKNMKTKSGYSFEVDWWTLGALLIEMLTGQPPFTAQNMQQVRKHRRWALSLTQWEQ